MDKKEQTRLRVQRYRNKKKSVTKEKDVTQDVTAMRVAKTMKVCGVAQRYLTLSDGQVFDRTYQPEPNKHLPAMIACNRADEADLSRGMSKAKRIAMVMRALDRTMTGLDGKPVKLGSLVRYGVSGYTFNEISQLLT